MSPTLLPKSSLPASILQEGINRASFPTPQTWPGCAAGCCGQKHKVHLPSCAQKHFQHSQHEVWGRKFTSEAQHGWLSTPKTWSDPTAFGNFCLASTTLTKLNLFCHQELHDQLRRGSVCVSASPSKVLVYRFLQVIWIKNHSLSSNTLSEVPRSLFFTCSMSSASAGGPMNF